MPAIPTQGSDPNKGSGDWLTGECDAIFVIEDYKEVGQPGADDWHCLISAYVHSSSVADQVQKKVKDEKFFFMKAKNKIFEFACALGLYNKPQWDADVAAGNSPNIPLEESVGLMFATPVRHKKWDDSRDSAYWNERLQNARSSGDDKMIEKCERILREKKGNLQIGGSSGFTFWAIGDQEADHIPLSPQDIAAISPQGLLPTKMGTPRKRGSSAGAQMAAGGRPAASHAGAGGAAAGAAAATRPAAATPAAGGVGASFM